MPGIAELLCQLSYEPIRGLLSRNLRIASNALHWIETLTGLRCGRVRCRGASITAVLGCAPNGLRAVLDEHSRKGPNPPPTVATKAHYALREPFDPQAP